MTDPHQAAEEYWAAAEARDWDAYAALLTDDVVFEMPQSRERIRGKENYMSFNTGYPADWHATVRYVIAEGRRATSWCDVVTDGVPQVAVTFFTFDSDGLICHITDFWPDPAEPPAWRAHLVEIY